MASDFHLRLEGIEGESQDSKHKNEIEILSFSWGATNAGSHATGSGGGSGKVSFQDVHFTAYVSKASPLLMLRCADGTHIPKGILTVRKQGQDQQEFYTVTLDDLLVSSYQSGDSTGGSIPTDQFSLNFAKIKFEYKPQKADGTLAGAVGHGWNIKAGVKI